MLSSPDFILRDFTGKNRCLQILRNTVAPNSYLGLSALTLSKKICLIVCSLCINMRESLGTQAGTSSGCGRDGGRKGESNNKNEQMRNKERSNGS